MPDALIFAVNLFSELCSAEESFFEEREENMKLLSDGSNTVQTWKGP